MNKEIKQRLYVGYYNGNNFGNLLHSIYESDFKLSFVRSRNMIHTRYLNVFGSRSCYVFVNILKLSDPIIDYNCMFLLTGFSDAVEFLSETMEENFPRRSGIQLLNVNTSSHEFEDLTKRYIDLFKNYSNKAEIEMALEDLANS